MTGHSGSLAIATPIMGAGRRPVRDVKGVKLAERVAARPSETRKGSGKGRRRASEGHERAASPSSSARSVEFLGESGSDKHGPRRNR
jgi:hypothetical protein